MFAFGDTRAGFFGSRRVAADLGLLRVKAFVYLLRPPAFRLRSAIRKLRQIAASEICWPIWSSSNRRCSPDRAASMCTRSAAASGIPDFDLGVELDEAADDAQRT